jgi:hypothetical protein
MASEIDSYEEDGEVYDREKLGLRPNDPIFMKHDVPENFDFGKPHGCRTFQMAFSTQETPQLVLDSEFIRCDKHHISNLGKSFL